MSCHPMPGGVHSPLLCHVTRTPALRCGGVHVWFLEGPQPSSVLGTGPWRPHLWVGTPQSACLMECPGAPSRAGHCQGLSNERQLSFRWAVDGGVSRDRPCVGGLPRGPLPQRPGVCCGRVLGLLQPLLASLSTHSGPPAPEQRGGWGARPSVASVSVCEVGGTAAPSLPQGSGGRTDEPGVHPTDRCGCPPSSAHP